MTHTFFPFPHEIPGLLDGTVTLLVRPCKKQPPMNMSWSNRVRVKRGITGLWVGWDDNGDEVWNARCPWRTGDRLIGKETWRVGAWNYSKQSIAVDYRADGYARQEWLRVPDINQFLRYAGESYLDGRKAGYATDTNTGKMSWSAGHGPTRWRSPVTMPAWASRFTLEVTAEPGCKRVQEVTWQECVVCGVSYIRKPGEPEYFIDSFRAQFDADFSRRGHTWDANPIVWLPTVRRGM